jgi:threonine dehydratase
MTPAGRRAARQPIVLRPLLPGDSPTIDLASITEASRVIGPYIKRSPLMYASLATRAGRPVDLALKLENLQVGGSMQVRGLINAVLHAPQEQVARGLVTVNFGGAHYSAAAAYIAALLEVPIAVYFSRATSDARRAEYRAPRMQTYVHGSTWESAARYATEQAARHGQVFLHPFADPLIIAGFGTVGLDIVRGGQPPTVVVVPAYTSGSELCGIAAAIKAVAPDVRVVGVEAEGAARLHESLRHGRPTSIVTNGPRRPSDLTFDLAQRYVDEIVLVTADEAREAVQTLWRELEVFATVSAATAVAAILADKIRRRPRDRVLAVVTGTGKEGLF